MKFTCYDVAKLSPEAQIELLNRIIKGAIEFDKINEDFSGAIELILFHTIDNLNEADNDDEFGSEGWRHAILGED